MVLHMKLRKLYHLVCFLSLFQAVICLSQVSDSISHYLMDKYSNSSGYLTKDDLQKLLDKLKTCCSINSTLMDPSADSAPCNQSQYCSLFQESFFSAENVFTHLKIEDGKFSATSLEQMCPLVLGQLENSACNLNSEFGSKDSREEKRKPTQSEVWGYGFLFVTLISLCSLLGVSVLPFMGKEFYKQLLTALIGLAVGSLAASSVFHLIPQAFGLVDLDSHHNYLSISIMMWSGIWVFFMTERIMKIITDARQKKIASKDKVNNPLPAISSQTNISHQSQKTYDSEPLQHAHDSCMISDPGAIYDYQEQAIKASFGHQEKPHVSHEHVMHFEQGKDSAIATVAWMVIFGDGLHNFIDGLSIGAAFNESILTGISISVAVMCEEFPHELGDFAVLLNAGMSLKQALLYNFLSACTCYLGLILGILLGEIEASIYIFGFAAGMFLYISLVDMQAVDSPKQPAVTPVRMVPEMNEVAEEASKISVKKAFQTLLLQNLGMAIGVSALYILALYQDSINFN